MTRIVFADDDADIRYLAEVKLTSLGYEVDTYPNGRQAFDAIVADPPALAILDLLMPVMDGLECARAIRQVPALADLPVMILSALTQEKDKDAGFDAGANYYFTKPFSPAALGEYVHWVLTQ